MFCINIFEYAVFHETDSLCWQFEKTNGKYVELEQCQTNVKFVVTSNTCHHDDEEKPVESCEIPEKTAFKICE